MRVVTLPGVFKPRSDSWMLAEVVRERVGGESSVLDVCTGSGVVAVSAALAGAGSITAVDVSRRAIVAARMNALINGVRLDARRGSLFEPVAGQYFDLIAANPPYVPALTVAKPRGAARAWDAGPDGRELLAQVIAGARTHLNPGGALLLVQSSVTGEQRTLELMRAAGLSPSTLRRERSPLGPLHAARAELLEARGLLELGRRHEDVLVIRGLVAQSRVVSDSNGWTG